MSHSYVFALVGAAVLLACTARTPLRELAPMERREIGEAAVAQVCGFPLDVESEITRTHERTRAVALEYIAIASETAADVRREIGVLVEQYGTDAELLERLRQMSSPAAFCDRFVRADRFSRYRGVCETHYPARDRSIEQ